MVCRAGLPVVSLEIKPRFPRHGAGNRGPVSSKTLRRKPVPNWERAWGEPSLLPFGCKLGRLPTIGQFRVAGLAIQHRLLHSHRLRPQPGHPKSKIQTPKSKLLDGPTPFGSCIRYFHVTPTRVGGYLHTHIMQAKQQRPNAFQKQVVTGTM